MEEPPGVETGPAMETILRVLRYFRPPTYSNMPYIQRLKADFFTFSFVILNSVVMLLSLAFCAAFLAIGTEIPAKLTVVTYFACVSTGMCMLVLMALYSSKRMGTVAAGVGIMTFILVPTVGIGLMIDIRQFVVFPILILPFFMVHMTNMWIGYASAVLSVIYYCVWAYVAATDEPVMVEASAVAFQGIAVTIAIFMAAVFHKTATVWREASIAATVLEEATFEALLIFDRSGLVR